MKPFENVCIKPLALLVLMPILAWANAGAIAGIEQKADAVGDTASVTAITARYRYPWSGTVDIAVTLRGLPKIVEMSECELIATDTKTKKAIPVEHVRIAGADTGSENVWTRRFIWDALFDIGSTKIDDIELTVRAKPIYVKLWEGGPYWSTVNIGATKPEEVGSYFWWGDVVGSDPAAFVYKIRPTYDLSIYQLQVKGYIDVARHLVAEYDAATHHFGVPWRMPTKPEFEALVLNCDIEFSRRNGHYGMLAKGRGAYAAKSIFLPADEVAEGLSFDGYGTVCSYWSSTPHSDDDSYPSYDAYYFCFSSSHEVCGVFGTSRNYGMSVRPLRYVVDTEGDSGMTVRVESGCPIEVQGLVARPHSPWDGLVDIAVTLQGTAADLANATCTFVAENGASKAAITVEHITRTGMDTGSGNVWTRHFVWDTKADVGAVRIDDIALTVNVGAFDGVQLWEGGPYWAECNVGALKPEDCGHHFWWGDTTGYVRNAEDDAWISVRDSQPLAYRYGWGWDRIGISDYSRIAVLQADGYVDSATNLLAAYDAATANLGAPWRMPTKADLVAMANNCDFAVITQNGVSGCLVKGRGDYSSKSIFLPHNGIYRHSDIVDFYGRYPRSSTLTVENFQVFSCSLIFSTYVDWIGLLNDFSQPNELLPVRPVRGFAGAEAETLSSATTRFALDCPIEVKGLVAQPQQPRNGLVDVIVTLRGAAADVADATCVFVATNGSSQAAIPVAHITRTGADTGSGNVWTRHFVWDAKADVSAVKIDDLVLAVGAKIPLGGVQLWAGGPYWAKCNVGATKPAECGHYFWWGDTGGYRRNAESNGWVSAKAPADSSPFSFDSANCPTYGKTDMQLRALGYIDDMGNLKPSHDAATANLGAPWRMPTQEEIFDFYNNCDIIWTTYNGMNGRIVTGRGAYAEKFIFLPATGNGLAAEINGLGSYGYCWSATLHPWMASNAWSMDYGPFHLAPSYYDCNMGLPVRPLRGVDDVAFTAFPGTTVRFALDCREKTDDMPVVAGDDEATVTGDATNGFVVRPSAGNRAVEVTIPSGVDAAKVTIEVSPAVISVKPQGANVRIVRKGHDITAFLDVPTADGNGIVDLTKATVRDEIVKETLDTEKGAIVELSATKPVLTTPNTYKGLFYRLREGVTLGEMTDGDSTTGDGTPWTPTITVKGGNSAFYSIEVEKSGE